MGIIAWILFGLIVGLIARLLHPGRDPGGLVATVLIGIGGSLIGGFIGRALGLYASGRRTGGFVLSVIGAVVLPHFINDPIAISDTAALGAIVVAVTIGLIFGVYPATRAARLAPIDALRSE